MRVLIKISGEALRNHQPNPIDRDYILSLAKNIRNIVAGGIQVVLITGWGNICRWEMFAQDWVSRNTAHEVGMLATIINGLILQDALLSIGQECTLYTARSISTIGKIFHAHDAEDEFASWKVVLVTWWTGNPYFTTDTASVLRSVELGCNMMIKCTSVDGVYSADPKKDPTAQKFDTISYDEILAKNLRIMDQTAIALARDNNVNIGICHIDELKNLWVQLAKNKFSWSLIGNK